jgi:hypothetical protein
MYIRVLAGKVVQSARRGWVAGACEDGRIGKSVDEGVDEMQADATV